MFQKKEILFNESIGVCRVRKIVKLTADKSHEEGVPYYVLESLADGGKVSYIPVEHHQVLLRPLLTKEEAQTRLKSAEAAAQKEAACPFSEAEMREIHYVLENDG